MVITLPSCRDRRLRWPKELLPRGAGSERRCRAVPREVASMLTPPRAPVTAKQQTEVDESSSVDSASGHIAPEMPSMATDIPELKDSLELSSTT